MSEEKEPAPGAATPADAGNRDAKQAVSTRLPPELVAAASVAAEQDGQRLSAWMAAVINREIASRNGLCSACGQHLSGTGSANTPDHESGAATPALVDARCRFEDRCKDKGVYRMIGSCYNCHAGPILGLFTAGHERHDGVLGEPCPVCEIRNLHWTRLATPDEIPVEFEEAR